MDANDNEELIESLAPSAAMLPLLGSLSEALERLKRGDKTLPRAYDWDDIPMRQFSEMLARFPLALQGWPQGRLDPINRSSGERDLLHHLLSDLDIMSEEDLEERFRSLMEGSRLAAAYRKIAGAPAVANLLRNEIALGWGGFSMTSTDPQLEERVRRRRMYADRYRGVFDWTHVRAWDIAQGAVLVLEADACDVLIGCNPEGYFSRISGEMLVRFSSWHEYARALLFSYVWLKLEEGIGQAEEALAEGEKTLDMLLTGPWAQFPWPRIRKSDIS